MTTFIKLCEHAGACYDVYRPGESGLERCKAICAGALLPAGPSDAETTNTCQIPGFGHGMHGLRHLLLLFNHHVCYVLAIMQLLTAHVASQVLLVA